MIFFFLYINSISKMFITQTQGLGVKKSMSQHKNIHKFRKTLDFNVGRKTHNKNDSQSDIRSPFRQLSCFDRRNTKQMLNIKQLTKPLRQRQRERSVPSHICPKSKSQDQIATEKWKKVVELYNMSEYVRNVEDPIQPGISFYRLLCKAVSEPLYQINLPETIMLNEDGAMLLLQTNQQGFLTRQIIQKSSFRQIFFQAHDNLISDLKKYNKYNIYCKRLDIKKNINAPFIISKRINENSDNEDPFKMTTQVQTFKNFEQNRSKPTRDCLLQRYVYSRNLKAMVYRVCYNRNSYHEQKQIYTVYRFQNLSDIFKLKGEDQYDVHELRSKISLKQQRTNTLIHTVITNPVALNKFTKQASQLRRLIETSQKVQINKMYVDFIDDLFDKVWLINIKYIELDSKITIRQLSHTVAKVGYCKLCSGIFAKKDLQNNVSVRMLFQFLQHLRRRTKIQNMNTIDFANGAALNRRQNAMSAVCQCCYALIIKQMQLKKWQNILARLCHVRLLDNNLINKNEENQKLPLELKQWRLMIYLEEITQIGKNIPNVDTISIRYSLGRGIEEKWKCKMDQDYSLINRVKIHYFYSQTYNIEEFLNKTEIVISIIKGDSDEILAQGSTGIISNFKNKLASDSGQRQTSTVLLFFESGKYCELTLKVGLVCDGCYKTPETNLKKVNSVYFPSADNVNSNPLPKEWMQAFGHEVNIQVKDVRYQDIINEMNNKFQSTNQTTTLLKKRPIQKYFQ